MALIVGIIALTKIGNDRRWHERWMDYRLLAERLRLQRTLAPLGRVIPDTRRPAHQSSGELRETWVGWYFRALVRALGMIPGHYDEKHVEGARAVAADLLTGKDMGQIAWHRGNAERFKAVADRLHGMSKWLFYLTGGACALHLAGVHWPWLTLVAAAFPAFGAAMGAVAMHLQLERIAKHSTAMATQLAHLDAYLKRVPGKSAAVARPCEEIAECMITEVLDWRTLFRGKLMLP
jgi:hypothetical protein